MLPLTQFSNTGSHKGDFPECFIIIAKLFAFVNTPLVKFSAQHFILKPLTNRGARGLLF